MDSRLIQTGWIIPSESYSDQPSVVRTADGAWLCAITTGSGREGERGQHIVTRRSQDHGRTWGEAVDVEPANGPEASYAVLLAIPGGRVFCFYNHNTDDIRAVKADAGIYPGGYCQRVDSQGHFVFKYSDDQGLSWSADRYDIPMRLMDIDRNNPYGGNILFFWNVGKPFVHHGAAYVPLHKVGGFGEGFFVRSEGVLLKCAHLLTENNPAHLRWETLPDGDFGLAAPPGGGLVAEEQSFTVLSDGSLYSVYRTVDGHPAYAYSRDGGRTWSKPAYQAYADGRLMKHPRAANFIWRCRNGHYLYWFHNHGGHGYEDRNPAWLSCGREIDTPEGILIEWSEPEIVLYDDDPLIRISYPDLIEEQDDLYLLETQKAKARVHRVDPDLLNGLWQQFDQNTVSQNGLVLELKATNRPLPDLIPMPVLHPFIVRDDGQPDYRSCRIRSGFSIELLFTLMKKGEETVLLDSRREDGRGFCLKLDAAGYLALTLNDGLTFCSWSSEPGLPASGQAHHVVVTVDGGPCIITCLINGKLCDGGVQRQFGWGRFSPNLRDINGARNLRMVNDPAVKTLCLRLYDRPLSTSEAIGNQRAASQQNQD